MSDTPPITFPPVAAPVIGTPEFSPAFTTPEGVHYPATLNFNSTYPELNQAGQRWWNALNDFHIAVDGTALGPDGHPVPVEGRTRHPALEAFHNDLKTRTNDPSLAEPRTPMWRAQQTIEGTGPRPEAPNTAIVDEIIPQYMEHIPQQTQELANASERLFAHRVELESRQLEHLRTYGSINELPNSAPILMEAEAQPTLQNLITERETLVGQLQREWDYIKESAQKILGFRAPAVDEAVTQTTQTLGGGHPPPPPQMQTPAITATPGGYYSAGTNLLTEKIGQAEASHASQMANKVEAQIAKTGGKGKWGLLAGAVGLGAVAFSMFGGHKEVADKGNSQNTRG